MSGANAHYQLYQIPPHPYNRECLPVAEIHRNGNPPGYICRASQTVTLLFIPKWVTYPDMERLAGGLLNKHPGLSGQPNTPFSTTPHCLASKTLLKMEILQQSARQQQRRQPVTYWNFCEQLSRQDRLRRSEGL